MLVLLCKGIAVASQLLPTLTSDAPLMTCSSSSSSSNATKHADTEVASTFDINSTYKLKLKLHVCNHQHACVEVTSICDIDSTHSAK
jgi:hypothetical protein